MNKFSWCIPSFIDTIILIVLLLLGALLGNLVVLALFAVLGQEVGSELGMIVSYPLMFVPPMIWANSKSKANRIWSNGASVDTGNFAPLSGVACAFLVMVGTLSMAFACDALNSLMPPMPQWLEEALGSMTGGNFLLNFLCVSIMAPLFEEWLCRGMVLRGLLVRGVKPVWAIAFSAFFFAVIHLNPWQALPAFLLGLLFGYVYYKTGSLKLTMLMHFTNNTMALVIGQIDSLKDAQNWVDVLGNAYWLFFALSIVVLALVVRAFKRIVLNRTSGNYDILPPISAD